MNQTTSRLSDPHTLGVRHHYNNRKTRLVHSRPKSNYADHVGVARLRDGRQDFKEIKEITQFNKNKTGLNIQLSSSL